jgi:hypothetical protein
MRTPIITNSTGETRVGFENGVLNFFSLTRMANVRKVWRASSWKPLRTACGFESHPSSCITAGQVFMGYLSMK